MRRLPTQRHALIRRLLRRAFVSLLAVIFVALAASASAQTQEDGSELPVRIAIPTFSSDTAETEEWAQRIARVLAADLARSQAFIPLEQTALVRERVSLNAMPSFTDWRATNARALLVGRVTSAPGGRLRLAFRLWDVASGQQRVGAQYYAPQQHWRRLAHVAADAVYSNVTGVPGYFDTRIAFIEQRNDVEPPVTRLAVMDQDGRNLEYLTKGVQPALSPRFSPVAQQLIYVVDTGGAPRLILRDLHRGLTETIGDFPGLMAPPRFAPDGHRIVMSLRRGGNANLYEIDLRTRTLRRLTETAAIDTAPSFSPSGRHVVFVSGRSGTRQLYVMRANGRSQQRISRGEGRYAEPVWSPRGDFIAFVKRLQGQAFLGVMKPDGSQERLLTAAPDIGGLSWAPNGRALVFSRLQQGEQGKAELVVISLNGNGERVLETPHPATDPSWSAPLEPRGSMRRR
ncbi:Tol-Pal system beta propeller repeat protein TolB [Dichotomicrobium thermohalophilum]|uniref:Tol-Pal system protein TolB n=1 Tax=Dichotomicrobium thermohalophilum TaxID=933063 RepID=A0A397QB68_9HYPH|nr:Tol-Pal system beta propeller repeat protein TolB [Dichotomicrobium thermohalophilum]RIA55461.1 TolB protein [Dichotomicrobium thermohalophilum]